MADTNQKIIEHLAQFVSENRKAFIERVLAVRTRHLTVVLEDVFHPQNASAVVRTCECMGLQDIHIVEQISKYEINPRVLRGANKWMTLHRYDDRTINNTQRCYEQLRERGYTILAADPSPQGVSIHDIDVNDKKIALVFGNELRGVSDYGLSAADRCVHIPMYGFTESLNLSVSVAICVNSLITRLHQYGNNFFLSEEEKNDLRLSWFRRIVRGADLIEKEFLRTFK